MHTIKRSVLHALVWAKPMTQIGKELGISDVGLAKCCRRNAIPTPPRGHWMKLAAGKRSQVIPLPQAENDFDIALTTVAPAQRELELKQKKAHDAVVAEITEQLTAAATERPAAPKRVHPLIRATRAFAAKIPSMERAYARARRSSTSWAISATYPPALDKGRRLLEAPDGLSFSVSDEAIPWAIDWHEQLFSILESADLKFSTGNRPNERQRQLVLDKQGEQLFLRLNESYKRRTEDQNGQENAADLDGLVRDRTWAPSGRLTLQAHGTEYRVSQSWSGPRENLDQRIHEIAASLLALLEQQPKVRAERLDAEAKMQAETRRREQERQRAQALIDQVGFAMDASQLFQRKQQLLDLLNRLETDLPTFVGPFRQRLTVWITVIREQLEAYPPHLTAIEKAIAGNRWRNEAPAWWPESVAWPT